ncbi:MAG TPA: hypothetical protein VG225_04490 [Terracidiphilus sp.]|jgi:hypothetical protein|nr:hypothetical protein [Terracidiphilus sp.]
MPLFLLLALCPSAVVAQSYMARVSATQAAQPHWMTPVATVTPRLEQEFRFDVLHEVTPTGDVTNLDNGKGLELIPTRRTELLINLPPYLVHENPATKDGWGDASFTMKYRFLSRNEEGGNAILTGFLAGSVPTGQFKNGSISAVVTPTLAGGKGWGWFDVQSTLGGTFPVDSVRTLGRTILSNTALQAHVLRKLWPEVEINSTFWRGGSNDGRKQTFVTPAINFGRFPIHKRIALVAGAGFQIATTHYHQYNHGFIATLRMPF